MYLIVSVKRSGAPQSLKELHHTGNEPLEKRVKQRVSLCTNETPAVKQRFIKAKHK